MTAESGECNQVGDNKKGMKRLTIEYAIDPSFEFSERLHVQIAWNDDRQQYQAEIEKGVYERQNTTWFDEAYELDAILTETAALQLPLLASDQFGLDGTTYTLRIGCQSSVEYSWWVGLPAEWAALAPLLDKIMQVVDRKLTNRS